MTEQEKQELLKSMEKIFPNIRPQQEIPSNPFADLFWSSFINDATAKSSQSNTVR